MKNSSSLSRRESLLGIAGAGTVLGGSALGISSVMAGEDEDDIDDADDHNAKKAGFELALVCYEKGTATFRVHNETAADAKLAWKVDTDLDDGYDGDDDGEDYDPDGETTEDDEEVDDDNGDDENGDDDDEYHLKGTVAVPKRGEETFEADVLSKDATITLYRDGKKVAASDVEKLHCEKSSPADAIDLEAVCYRLRKDDDYYGDDNGDDDDDNGDDAPEDYDPDGETIEDGEEVDDDGDGDDNGDDDNGDDGYDNGDDKRTVREAKFRVTNGNKKKVKVHWTVDGGDRGGKLSVAGRESESFWVTASKGEKTSVTLTYDGDAIATAKAETDVECDDC